MVKRPIDSFKQYFLDVKPYHTKILEIIEQYKFQEDIDVTLQESLFFQETLNPEALCHGTGFGLDFDDECGFDADECCDLFESCLGGYGLIYDNNDLLVSAPVFSTSGHEIVLDGDYRYDTFFQIHDTVGTGRIKIKGNVVAAVAPHYLFVVIKKNRYDVAETRYNGFYFSGNLEEQFTLKNEFTLFKSGANDDAYSVISAVYNSTENRTFVEVYIPEDREIDTTSLGFVLINSDSKNNAVYQRTDVYFDGTNTNIVLHEDTQLALPGESEHGVIVLRTALKAPRHVWFSEELEAPDEEWKIVDSFYDLELNQTTIVIETSDGVGSPNEVNLRGYFSSAGFDGAEECTTPKPNHLYASFSEFLEMTVTYYPPA